MNSSVNSCFSGLQLNLHHIIEPQLAPIAPCNTSVSLGDLAAPYWCSVGSFQFFEPFSGLSCNLTGKSFYAIGRSDSCDIIIQDSNVSRNHAVLFHHCSGELYICDLHSSNGTYIGEQRLVPNIPYLLRKSSVLRFGSPITHAQYFCRAQTQTLTSQYQQYPYPYQNQYSGVESQSKGQLQPPHQSIMANVLASDDHVSTHGAKHVFTMGLPLAPPVMSRTKTKMVKRVRFIETTCTEFPASELEMDYGN